MAEVLQLNNGTVIRGGMEAFTVLEDIERRIPSRFSDGLKGYCEANGHTFVNKTGDGAQTTKVETPTQPRLKGSKPKPLATPAKSRLELPKQQRVAKTEAVEELKVGDWLKGLQSLTTKGKEGEATK